MQNAMCKVQNKFNIQNSNIWMKNAVLRCDAVYRYCEHRENKLFAKDLNFQKKPLSCIQDKGYALLTTYNTSVLSYAAPLTVSNRRGLLKFSPRLRSDIHQFALYRALTAPGSLRLCKKTTVSFNAFSYGDIITYITI